MRVRACVCGGEGEGVACWGVWGVCGACRGVWVGGLGVEEPGAERLGRGGGRGCGAEGVGMLCSSRNHGWWKDCAEGQGRRRNHHGHACECTRPCASHML